MSVTLLSRRPGFRFLASWSERGIGVLVLGGGAALLIFGDHFTRTVQALLAGLLLLFLVVGLRRGWITLFGPVLPYDLVRTARHSRSFLLRCVYVAALLAVLFLLYSERFGESSGLLASLLEDHRVPPAEMAGFADAFFSRFLALQLGAVLLLTPVYTASALAEQKERKTLDYLLTTDLRSSEIVLGTLASRLAHLGLFLLAGLPILGLLQLLGGVDPNLVLAGFAGTALTMLSLASLGILISAYAERSRTAILVTYLVAGMFLMCSFPIPGLSVGNPLAAWNEIMEAAEAGTVAPTASRVLRSYALVHVSIAVLCCLWASISLRAWSQLGLGPQPEIIVVRVRTTNGSTLVWRQLPPPAPNRPPVLANPLMWKEKYVEALVRCGPNVRALLAFVVIVGSSIAGLSFLGVLALLLSNLTGRDGAAISTLWVRLVGTPIACLLWVGVAVRSAASFSREREQCTWDSLLTTPMEVHEIFQAKAWGSIVAVRSGWWFLGIVWGLGTLTLGLNLLMGPLLAAAWLAHAALIAGIGMWFSLVSRTTPRATVYTFLVAGALSVGPPLFASLVETLWFVSRPHAGTPWLVDFCFYGTSPPLNLWALAFGWDKFPSIGDSWSSRTAAVAGIPVVAAAAAAVWALVSARLAGRDGRAISK